LKLFDQVDIPAEAIPTGVRQIHLEREIGQALLTFLNPPWELTRQDPVFLQKGLVSSEAQVRGWLPEAFRPPQGPPPVIVATSTEIRDLIELDRETLPSVRLTALVIAAEGEPGKLLIVEVFTLRDYRGRELLLISV
jgi:hypothetical protein